MNPDIITGIFLGAGAMLVIVSLSRRFVVNALTVLAVFAVVVAAVLVVKP